MPFFESAREKIKGFLRIELPPMELPPERENELIEKIARIISRYGMEGPAILMTSGFVPVSTIMSLTTLLPLAPLLELMGIHGYEYTAFLNNKNNLKRLLERLDELRREREGI